MIQSKVEVVKKHTFLRVFQLPNPFLISAFRNSMINLICALRRHLATICRITVTVHYNQVKEIDTRTLLSNHKKFVRFTFLGVQLSGHLWTHSMLFTAGCCFQFAKKLEMSKVHPRFSSKQTTQNAVTQNSNEPIFTANQRYFIFNNVLFNEYHARREYGNSG